MSSVALRVPPRVIPSSLRPLAHSPRRHRRILAPSEARATLFRGEAFVLEGALRDLSAHGLGLVTAEISPGWDEDITTLELKLPGRSPLFLSGSTRHVSTARVSGSLYGVQLRHALGRDAAAWFAYVDELLHPQTQPAFDADRLWNLYSRSNYVRVMSKTDREPRGWRGAFATATAKLANAPLVSCTVAWPGEERLEAAVTMLKPFASTWLGCHLARQPDEGPVGKRLLLRQLVTRALEYPERDAQFAWLLSWVHRDARFSAHLFGDFARLPAHKPGDAAVVPFRIMRGRVTTPNAPRKRWLRLGTATSEEQEHLLRRLAATKPRAYLEAHDLVPARFDLSATREAWSKAGLSREREVLVVRRGTSVVAAAIVEAAEPGVHLAGWLDAVRIVDFDSPDDDARVALLNAARAWYKARGRDGFVYFLESNNLAHALAARLEDQGEADAVVVAASLSAPLIAWLHSITT